MKHQVLGTLFHIQRALELTDKSSNCTLPFDMQTLFPGFMFCQAISKVAEQINTGEQILSKGVWPFSGLKVNRLQNDCSRN